MLLAEGRLQEVWQGLEVSQALPQEQPPLHSQLPCLSLRPLFLLGTLHDNPRLKVEPDGEGWLWLYN